MSLNPCCRPHRAGLAVVMMMPAVGLVSGPAVASEPPVPQISVIAVQGTAPFTAHVHALESQLDDDSPLKVRFEWDFGDPSGDYDRLEGFNAAHRYAEPGTYEVGLRLTSRFGVDAETSVVITVHPDVRRRIYVAPDGDDASDGSSASAPVRTAGRAVELLSDDAVILFQRGGVYPTTTLTIDRRNVRLRAYGNGARPVLHWNGPPQTFAAVISLTPACEAVVIDHLEIRADGPAGNGSVRGISARGRDVTIHQCRFVGVSSAIMAEAEGVTGLLTEDNSAPVIGAYFVWGAGTDQTHLGNVVAGSVDQHNMRFVGDRILVAHNDLSNTYKSCVWFQIGNYAYLARNKINYGPAQVGPIPQLGDPAARWRWSVMEANRVFGDSLKVLHGATHVMIRNNVCVNDGGRAIEVLGADPVLPRTTVDVDVLNNTAVNMGEGGKFLEVGPDGIGLTVVNNLYCAPNLVTGSAGTSNVYVADSDLTSFAKLRNNIWAAPDVGWGAGVHYVWPFWSHPSGYRSEDEWSAFVQTGGETYHEYLPDDLDAQFAPQFDADIGVSVTGVFNDMYDNPRPPDGPITAGAVQVTPPNPPPGGGTDTTLPPGEDTDDEDDDGDGDVPDLVFFADDFETDLGWAVSGIWQRGVPAGTGLRGDPVNDTDGSGQCFLTGNAPGDSDVDHEPSRLASPVIDVSGGVNPVVHYAVWFHSGEEEGGDGLEVPEDPGAADRFEVRISSDAGATWVFVEEVPPTSGWWARSFRVADYVTLTPHLRLRFSVSDRGTPTVVEAAVDDVRLVDAPGAVPAARFVDLGEWYVVGSGQSLALHMLDAAPPEPNVVFQVWSHVSERIEVAWPDFEPPFAYPSELLDQVPLGLATVQAVVRDANSHPVEVVGRQAYFTDDTPPIGDIDGDGVVSVEDLLLLLQSWGACPAAPQPCPADLDGDQSVGGTDLAILLEHMP